MADKPQVFPFRRAEAETEPQAKPRARLWEQLKKDKEDDVSGTKDHVRDDRPKSKTEEQITKGAEASGKTSKRNNIFSSFTPSSEFIDNREKVKYNVDVPVEGLPGFVTQEMLVGALKCQDETGYPASVTIAQIIPIPLAFHAHR